MRRLLVGVLAVSVATILAVCVVYRHDIGRELAWARQYRTYWSLSALKWSIVVGLLQDDDRLALPTDTWIAIAKSCGERSEFLEILSETRPKNLKEPTPCDGFGNIILLRGIGPEVEPPTEISLQARQWARLACPKKVTWVREFEIRSLGSDGVLSEPFKSLGVRPTEPWRDQVIIVGLQSGDFDRAVVENRGIMHQKIFVSLVSLSEGRCRVCPHGW